MAPQYLTFAALSRSLSVAAGMALIVFAGRFVLAATSDVKTVAELRANDTDVLDAKIEQARAKGTVLQIAVDPTCHYCEKSFPFYRALAASNAAKSFRIEALVSLPRDLGQEYLQSHDLVVDDILPVDFTAAGITGTPEIRVLDDKGSILQRWQGFLSVTQENEVVFLLGIQKPFLAASRKESDSRIGKTRSMEMNVNEAADLMRSADTVVVDARPRNLYSELHIQAARNIPLDELTMRSGNELSKTSNLILYCNGGDSCSRNQLETQASCARAVLELKSAGFKNSRLLSASLGNLRLAHVTLDSSERIYLPKVLMSNAFE